MIQATYFSRCSYHFGCENMSLDFDLENVRPDILPAISQLQENDFSFNTMEKIKLRPTARTKGQVMRVVHVRRGRQSADATKRTPHCFTCSGKNFRQKYEHNSFSERKAVAVFHINTSPESFSPYAN